MRTSTTRRSPLSLNNISEGVGESLQSTRRLLHSIPEIGFTRFPHGKHKYFYDDSIPELEGLFIKNYV
jgi:DNA-binding IclR family transcriptional regulator